MKLVIAHDLDFLLQADMPTDEKFDIIREIMTMVMEYYSWSLYKDADLVSERKRLIRKERLSNEKKIESIEDTVRVLLSMNGAISDNTINELLNLITVLSGRDISVAFDEEFQKRSKPNSKAIKARLTEIHDKYNIPHKTDNIRNFLSTLSNL